MLQFIKNSFNKENRWITIIVLPFVLWFFYLVTMMVWSTFCEKCPKDFYNEYIKPPVKQIEVQEEPDDEWEDEEE